MTEESHMGWKLVRGVRRNVVNLFQRFANANSVRFEDFCKVWKEMNFSLIYSNRVLFVEILEFTEELLQIVKEYLSSVYEFPIRVAAVYALYGLYFKQPIRGAAKIRFTKEEWEEVYHFIENSKTLKHYDVAFIFIKLYINGAYTFTATVRPLGLEHGYRKYFEKRTTLIPKAYDTELLYRPLISEKLLNSLVKLESLYYKKKSKLLGSSNLVFIDGEFAQSLNQELKNYEKSMQNQHNESKKAEIDVETYIPAEAESSEDSAQILKTRSSKSRKKPNPKENDDNEDSFKRQKPNKLHLNIMAKKKAEYYIQKFALDCNAQDSSSKNQKLMDLLPLEGFETSEGDTNAKLPTSGSNG